jgi:hypothetical protein
LDRSRRALQPAELIAAQFAQPARPRNAGELGLHLDPDDIGHPLNGALKV